MDNQPNQPHSTKNSPKKAGMWVIIIIVVIIIAGGVYYILTQDNTGNTNNTNTTNTVVNTVANVNENVNENTNTETNTNEATNENINAGTNTNTTVDIGGRETYENTEYGFSFKYPETWYFKDFTDVDQKTSLSTTFGTGKITSLGDTDTVFDAGVQTLQLNNGFTSADISAEFEVLITSSETLTIDGYNAIKYEAQTGNSTTTGLMVLIDPNTNLVIHLVSQSSVPSEDVSAIFNSLKIIK